MNAPNIYDPLAWIDQRLKRGRVEKEISKSTVRPVKNLIYQRAVEWLSRVLADYPEPVADILECGKVHGFDRETLFWARDILEIPSFIANGRIMWGPVSPAKEEEPRNIPFARESARDTSKTKRGENAPCSPYEASTKDTQDTPPDWVADILRQGPRLEDDLYTLGGSLGYTRERIWQALWDGYRERRFDYVLVHHGQKRCWCLGYCSEEDKQTCRDAAKAAYCGDGGYYDPVATTTTSIAALPPEMWRQYGNWFSGEKI